MNDPLWMAEQAFGLMTWSWPVAMVLLLVVVAGARTARPDEDGGRDRTWRSFALWLLAVWSFPPLLLILGSVWSNAEPYPSEPSWRSMVVLAVVVANLLVAVGAVRAHKGMRTLTVGASGLGLWISASCALVAGMSIANDWI